MPSFDIIIKGGTVIDGRGAPAREADVGIVGERVVEIGKLGANATRVIDEIGRASCRERVCYAV